jgi:hypothetical protein
VSPPPSLLAAASLSSLSSSSLLLSSSSLLLSSSSLPLAPSSLPLAPPSAPLLPLDAAPVAGATTPGGAVAGTSGSRPKHDWIAAPTVH